jgi:PKD repeat protein
MNPKATASARGGPFRISRPVFVPILVVSLLWLVPPGGVGSTHGESVLLAHSASVSAVPRALGPVTPAPGSSLAGGPAILALSPPVHWLNVSGSAAGTRPPALSSGAMAYDPLDHEAVYFGGCFRTVCANNQTWVFSNGTWTNITNPQDAPPARYGEMMDYDANMQGVLMFGGHGVGLADLNDTWLFQAGAWVNLTRVSSVTPAPRDYASMAFDPDPEENGSVLFGGNVLGFGCANDTWIWQGYSGWVFLNSSAAPPDSCLTQMAYDPADQAVVLFGCGEGCGPANETWELYSGQWWQVHAPNPTPSYQYGYRFGDALTFDAALSKIVLFGGYSFTGVLNDTWTFSKGVWTNVTASVGPAPPARYLAGMSADSSAFPPLLFGGTTQGLRTGNVNDTWVLEVPPTVELAASPTTSETSATVTVTATVTNGTAPYQELFDFGDGMNAVASSSSTSIAVTHAYLKAGTYSPSVNVTDAAGVKLTSFALPGVRVLVGPVLGPLTEPSQGDPGVALSFTGGVVTNGSSPFTFAWQFGDGGTAPGVNATHAYTAAGTYVGTLTVTDSLGGTAAGTFTVLVHPLPTATIAASPSPPVAASNTTFYGNVSGGTAPYHYSWSFGDGGISSVPYPAHRFSAAGSYTVQLWVNDSFGASVHQSLAVSVTSPSGTGSSGSSGAPYWFWAGVGGLVAVGAVGTVLLLRRPR